jgi:hypothetical protein
MRPVHRSSLLAPAVALLAIGCMGEAGPVQTRENAFAWQDSLPEGATLHVRDMNGEIEVSPSADRVARVTASISWRRGDPDASLHFSGVREGADAVICAVWGKGSCDKEHYSSSLNFSKGDTDARVHFRIEVPAGVRLELQGVNTDITAAASAPVSASTLNGDVTVVTAVGPVRGETKNGSVDIRMSSLVGTDSVIATTLNGDAFVYLPEGVDAALDLAVTNGSVSSEFAVPLSTTSSRRSLRATLGAGTRTVRIRSINGSVAVRRLDAAGKSYEP